MSTQGVVTMAKTKSARLSLTMPNAPQAASSLVRSPTSGAIPNRRSPDEHRQDREVRHDISDLMDDLTLQSPFQVDETATLSPRSKFHSSTPQPPRSPSSPRSPTFTSLPPFPNSPTLSPKHTRDTSRSFFANLKASKSSAKIQTPEATIRKVPPEPTDDSMKWLKKAKSSPDFAKDLSSTEPIPDMPVLADTSNVPTMSRHPVAAAAMQSSLTVTVDPSDTPHSRRRGNLAFANLMKRNHSTRFEDPDETIKPSTPTHFKVPDRPNTKPTSRDRSTGRNTSPYSESGDARSGGPNASKFAGRQLNYKQSQTFRDGSSNLLNGFRERTSKGFEGIGKAGNRLFKGNKTPIAQLNQGQGKYELQVINLPLAEQTRHTRIAQRLEDSKDKTEFWMPALPWRCIDYLNFNGCESEGIYRVPGGATQINEYKQRFDTELDVNLFDQSDLYDVNTIASVLKAWLIGLPDEILPKSTQDNITEKHAGEEGAPQLLKDELSKLPPFNYYLLFAITCHLSLLQAYVEKNKMDINALSVCFTIPLKMNRVCLRWLVKDWRNCWQGCWTEKAYLDEEYRILAQQDAENGRTFNQSPIELNYHDDPDRSLSSAGSGNSAQKSGHLTVDAHANNQSYLHDQNNNHHTRSASQLPALVPLQPLSPIFPEHPIH